MSTNKIKRNKITVYTDGSCNNKKTGKGSKEGGFGIVIRCGEHKKDFSSIKYKNTTSARMELRGVIQALNLCNPGWPIEIYCDNEYVVKTANTWLWSWISSGILNTKKNNDLWRSFITSYQKHGGKKNRDVKIIWVKGHAGNELNELADELANKGRKSKQEKLDTYNGF